MTTNLRAHCPVCRAIDWTRNGETIAVDVNGELHDLVPGSPVEWFGQEDAPWTCGRCGFQPPDGSELAEELSVLRLSDRRVLARSSGPH